jgi:hypothetical protein
VDGVLVRVLLYAIIQGITTGFPICTEDEEQEAIMPLDRKDIYDVFMKTRPLYIYDEFVPLWYMVRGVQRYMQEKQTKNVKLPDRIHVRPFMLAQISSLLKLGDSILIPYYTNDPFEVRLCIAESLGRIALQYIPEKLGQPSDFDDSCVLFFAQKMLEMNVQMINGAILRKFPVPVNDIPDEIVSRRGKFDISEEREKDVEERIGEIFPKYHEIDMGHGVLCCEVDIITEYIGRNLIKIFGEQVQEYRIVVQHSSYINDGTYSKFIYPHIARTIWHITPENAEIDLHEFYSKHDGSRITPISLIRLVIAHELGHAVLHQGKSYDDSDPIEERGASYFARLLLRRREWLYNGCKGGKNYEDACKQWDNLLRHIHRHDDKELIDWVLADD